MTPREPASAGARLQCAPEMCVTIEALRQRSGRLVSRLVPVTTARVKLPSQTGGGGLKAPVCSSRSSSPASDRFFGAGCACLRARCTAWRRSPEPATACVVVADRHACYLLQTRPIESAFGACRRQTLVLRAVLATGLDGRVAPSGDECVEWSGVVPRQPHRSAAKALVGRYARGLLRSLTNWV